MIYDTLLYFTTALLAAVVLLALFNDYIALWVSSHLLARVAGREAYRQAYSRELQARQTELDIKVERAVGLQLQTTDNRLKSLIRR